VDALVDKDSNIIAIIPARGGSKRIPRKNIRDFKGKPMIAWTIEAAKTSGLFKRVIVSTDDREIQSIAKQFGAEVPFLRQDHYDDITPVSIATLSALRQAEDYYDENYNVVAQLMPNCPLRNARIVEGMVESFLNTDSRSMLSHTRYGWLSPWWACRSENNSVKPLFPEELKKRSQDLPELYCPTGAIWIAKSDILKQEESFHVQDKKMFVMDWKYAVDIDDMEDWEMAEMLYEFLQSQSEA